MKEASFWDEVVIDVGDVSPVELYKPGFNNLPSSNIHAPGGLPEEFRFLVKRLWVRAVGFPREDELRIADDLKLTYVVGDKPAYETSGDRLAGAAGLTLLKGMLIKPGDNFRLRVIHCQAVWKKTRLRFGFDGVQMKAKKEIPRVSGFSQ